MNSPDLHSGTSSQRGWQRWLPAVLLATLGGLALLVLGIRNHSFGFVLVLCVPAFVGGVLGYGMRISKFLWQLLVAVLVLAALITGLITMNLAGLYCGAILGGILLIPTLIGVAMGVSYRRLKARSKRRAGSTSTLLALFFALGGGLLIEARVSPPAEIETIETRRVLAMNSQEVWESLLFYEEVRLKPPALARLGLPTPLYAEGRVERVGDVKRCIYQGGYLVKQITHYEPRQLLAFDVLDQVGVEDRSADLVGGRFHLRELPDGRTEVTLYTVYKPLLQARPIWRPFEKATTHALHNHVLDGIALGAPKPLDVLLADSRTR